MNSEQIAAIERLREAEKKLIPGNWESLGHYWTEADIRFMCSLRNEALPLIEALQAENERLRNLLKDACTDLGQMTLLRDKFYCEMETAQTEAWFAKRERDALQAECEALRRGHDKVHQSIDRALAVLQSKNTYYAWMIDGAIEILTGEGES